MIEETYPLSPMQRSMLFHGLHAPESTANFNQFSCRLTGEMFPEVFREAWEFLVHRHPILRSSFEWDSSDQPMQSVHKRVTLPWTFCDWRSLDPDTQRKRWREHLAADRAAGFAFDRAPLMRCRLARVSDSEYFFNWSHHHLLMDGWCLGVILEEYFQIYAFLRAGKRPVLPEVRPYREFIEWTERQDATASREYWTRVLAGFRSPTPLPERLSRRGHRTGAESQIEEALPDSLVEALKRLTTAHRITMGVVLQGAWALLLARMSGESDVVFGYTVSGRPAVLPDIERMIGLFINTVPVRVQIDPRQPLVVWLKMIQARQAARHPFEHVPLTEVQQWSEAPRGMALFDSNVIMMNYPRNDAVEGGSAGLRIHDAEVYDRTDFPLQLQLYPGSPWMLDISYNGVRFEDTTIQRMIGHVRTLLEAFAEHPNRPLGKIPIISAAEKRQVLVDFNRTDVAFDPDHTFVHRFEQGVAGDPSRVVLTFGDRAHTWGDFNARANRLARCLLQRISLKADDLVAIVARRSDRMAEAILATWKCGAAYVPVDPDYPASRIRSMIEQSQARLIVTQSGILSESLRAELMSLAPVAELESLDGEIAAQDSSNLLHQVKGRDLAYVIFTSGSTGRPKGAMVEHAGMMNHLLAKCEDLKIGPGSVIVQNASHCFDISVWQFFAAPMVGGRTVIYGDELVMDADGFIESVDREGVTILEVVPSYLAILLERMEGREAALRGLKSLVVTGETLSVALVDRWFRMRPGIPMVNAYGPTEAGDDITHHRMDRAPEERVVPVGRPLRNLRIYVVDEQMNLCPVGVRGEVCVSGIGVGRGYVGDSDRTAAVFGEDTFRVERGVRMYRTGDLGCFRQDGTLQLFGRKDHQVKIRGHRIELGEIECALALLPGVRQAVVVEVHEPERSYLCGYLSFESGAAMGPGEIATAVARSLPDFMVPAAFVVLDRLPLNSSGKVDRGALPAPVGPAESQSRTTAPRNPVEETLVGIWLEVLRIPDPGIHGNFFHLGGDSILSMQVVSRAARAGLKITTAQVFEFPTVAELALVAAAAAPATPAVTATAGPAPLTPIQRYFFAQNFVDASYYNQAILLETPAGLDVASLQKALDHVARSHDALRSKFWQEDGEWRQEVTPADIQVPFILESFPPGDLTAAIEAAQANLDLSSGRLMRAALFVSGPEAPGRLLLVVHHLAVDGVSWTVLLEDLYRAYSAARDGAMLPVLPPTASYRDWAMHLANLPVSRDLDRWLALSGPDDSASTQPNLDADAEEFVLHLGEDLTGGLLSRAPSAYHARVDDLLIAALALTLSEWSGHSRVRIDLEGHGRNDGGGLDVSRTIGWFTALYPVLLDLEGVTDAGAAIRTVKEQLRQVPSNGLSYGLLRYGGDPEIRRQMEAIPPSPVLFNYLGHVDRALSEGWKLASESMGAGRSPRQNREHLLEINTWLVDGRMSVAWEFNRRIHARVEIEALGKRYGEHLQRLVDHCLAPDTFGFTPSDFPAAKLSQRSLDTLVARAGRDIADVYALTPTQQGMLFESLHSPSSEAYSNRIACTLEGDLDLDAFSRAWDVVIRRHPALRTSFHWDGLEYPVQVVHDGVTLPWRDGPDDGHFDPTLAPLMRCSIEAAGARRWQFTWRLHHLLVDGWSCVHVLREVVQTYGALRRGEHPGLPPSRAFRRYVEWLQRQDSSAARRYWTARLDGFTTPTPLILGLPEMEGHSAPQGFDETEIVLSPQLSATLTHQAQQHQITLNTLAQGAWAVVLARYSGERDVVYGTVTGGRPPEIDGSAETVGLFINTLPVRVRVDASDVATWLHELQSEFTQQERFSYCPLSDIQSWSGVPNGTALFDSLLLFQNYPDHDAGEPELHGIRIADFQVFDPNHYPLTMVVTPGERISLRVLYDRQRFDHATARRILSHYQRALETLLAASARPVAALDILTGPEQDQILNEWNDTAVPFPQTRTVVELFEEHASRHPHRLAVKGPSGSRTYGELSEGSGRIAAALLDLAALGMEDRVAIAMARSERMVETILAIWKCGAAYVPIDLAYPAERIRTILEGAQPRVILVDSGEVPEHLTQAMPLGIPVLTFAEIAEMAARQTALVTPLAQPECAAYVIFTSGSTGKPKGAIVEQRGMLNHILGMARDLGLGETSCVAETASHCFDISVWQFFAALISGGRTVVYSDLVVLEPLRLADSMERDGVTDVQFVPSYLATFVAELQNAEDRPAFAGLRFMVTIGEILKPALVRSWFRLYPAVRMMNAYGPTEASDSIAHYTMDRPPELPGIPVGKPVQNLRLYILDHSLRLCPIGVKGEICVAGVGVGRGYLFDPERTSAVFGEDPFQRGERMYHTGDIGCYAPDGNILFFGRRDSQVKIRGHRIELGDVESAIAALDAVTNAVVLAREAPSGERYLCAYIASGERSNWTPASLRGALAERLPEYMLPDAVLFLPELPVLPNGKVDRKALPAPEDRVRVTSCVPRSPVEIALARIWHEVLGRDGIGIDDRFFEIGGHSLKAIQVLSRIRRDLGVETKLTDLFVHQTIRSLAAQIGGQPTAPHEIEAIPDSSWYAVSHTQKRIWLASRTREGSVAHNMPAVLEIQGPLDPAAADRALQSLLERHEILRTVFVLSAGELRQIVRPLEELEFRLRYVEHCGDIAAAIAEESARPFDLAHDPPVRGTLIHLGGDRHLLLLTLHHIAADAWSLPILFSELMQLYRAQDSRALPPLAIQYRDYAAWHNALLESAEMSAHRDYWLNKLSPLPAPLELRSDFSRSTPTASSGGRMVFRLESELAGDLSRLSKQYGTSLFGVMYAAISVLLHRVTGLEDITVGSQSAGRDHPQLESQIGAYLNTIVLRSRITAGIPIDAAISNAAQTLSEALDHRIYPYDRLLDHLRASGQARRAPLFTVQVDYIPALDWTAAAQPAGLNIIDRSPDPAASKFDLTFLIIQIADDEL